MSGVIDMRAGDFQAPRIVAVSIKDRRKPGEHRRLIIDARRYAVDGDEDRGWRLGDPNAHLAGRQAQ